MPPPSSSPEAITKALTQRAAASMLAKSPVWLLLCDYMSRTLTGLEKTILENDSLSAADLAQKRDQRLFLKSTLTSFANSMRSAFTSPPPSEDQGLVKMDVPAEVEAALRRLVESPLETAPAAPVAPPRQPGVDPEAFNPFEGKPQTVK